MQRPNTFIRLAASSALSFVLLTACLSPALAQDNDNKYHVCLQATPGIYWASTGDAASKSNGAKFGFGYGANVEDRLTETIYFVFGLNVNAAGVKYSTNDSTQSLKSGTNTLVRSYANTSSSNASIQYLQIPLFLKMKTKSIGMMKYYGAFGLGSGFAISNNTAWTRTVAQAPGTAIVGNGSVSSYPTSGTDTKTADVNPIRESLLIGAGAEYNLSGSTSITGSLMFDNGFISAIPSGKTGPSGSVNPTLYTKGITLTVGILF